ncbi:MAG: Sensor protein ZraS [Pedosphaera sp.]|nr:Sensor protein ZraS [Pedosphaera sp.]
MLTRRSWFVYSALLAIWIILIGWQAAEHYRVKRSARNALRHRAEDISNTLGLLMRSQRFFGVVTKERLESALNELVKQGELISVELLNATNEPVATAGAAIDAQLKAQLLNDEVVGGQAWDDQAQTLTLVNLVDLGTNIVMSTSEMYTNRPPPFRPGTNTPALTNLTNASGTTIFTNNIVSTGLTNTSEVTNVASTPEGTNSEGGRRRGGGGRRRGDPERPFERPYWMKEEEYKSIIEKKGVHGFIIVMPTQTLQPIFNQDFWLRAFIGILATVSVAGYGLAWGNLAKTSELQIRLVRASELNSHLKEMNLAAAGLAHETRNPLNIVRGLAQMISKQQDASPEIRNKSKDIIEETDRVTGQLNEFINYSRPREVRRAATNLNSVVAEVVRALNYDIEEKKVQLQILADPLIIEADEQLLRQALFNLVLNGIQAVPENGKILIRAGKRNNNEAYMEVADNGPGVAPEHRTEIFKPYFTTHPEGTGLGLAVVQQIVLAHGWEIECLPNQPSGAIFRVTHVKAQH